MNDINRFHINGETIVLDDFLMSVDMILSRIKESKNINIVTDAIKSLLGMQKISGIALSKFLWSINDMWSELGISEEFTDFIYATTGLQGITVQRYINVWNMFANGSIPSDLQSLLIKKPMKSLIVAATAISQGYEITEQGWLQFVEEGNEHSIRAIIRKEKGQAPRRNSLTIYLGRDGSLEAWIGDGEVLSIGYLNIDNKNENLQKAINRIITSSGIVVR